MAMLSAAAYARARECVAARARPVDQALCSHALDGDDGAAVAMARALGTYQNGDGGYGRGLEPDFRLRASSVLATTVASSTRWRSGWTPRRPWWPPPWPTWRGPGTAGRGAFPPCRRP